MDWTPNRTARWKKIIVLSLTFLMISVTFGESLQTNAAERLRDRNQNLGKTQAELEQLDMDDILLPTYGTTLEALQQEGRLPATESDIVIAANEFTGYGGSEPVSESVEGREEVLVWEQNTEWIEWTVEVPETGLYNIETDYYPLSGKRLPIQRELTIDGNSPFREAQRIYFYRNWSDRNDPIRNNQGDDIRPKQVEQPQWMSLPLIDGNGLYPHPYQFLLKQGKNVIRMNYIVEPIAFDQIRITSPEELPSYDEVAELYAASGYEPVQGVDVKIQAENNPLKSDPTIRREAHGDPLMEPAGDGRIRLNAFGDWRWRKGGQKATWTFTVPEDGLYKIGLKFGQWWGDGLPSYRQILIDGKVPFEELALYPFTYARNWQMETLHQPGEDGDENEPMLFYLTEGEHSLSMIAEVGPYQPIIEGLTADTQLLSDIYRRIIMVTGPTPDPNFEYEIGEKVPAIVEDLSKLADNLVVQMNALSALADTEPSVVNSLRMMNHTLQRMVNNPDSIPRQLSEISNSQTQLSDLLMGLQNVPLVLDYMVVSAPDTKFANVRSNALQRSVSTFKNFIASFSKDYTGIGNVYTADGEQTEGPVIEVWVARGKEWAEIMKDMAEEDFTPDTGIRINVNTLPAGQLNSGTVNTLLLAASSNNAPDVATGVDAFLPVEFAIRDAAVDLSQFSDYPAISKRFLQGALVPFAYNGGSYALPETQDFNVLVYRKDIMGELGLTVPQTWDEVYAMLPILQQNGMQIYYPPTSLGFMPFLYQHEGEFYRDNGMRSGLDSPEAFQAFTEWTELYTNYKFPVMANFFNRFRTGEMPIGVADYLTYVLLSTAAPELTGRWGVAPSPGHLKDDGTIDRTTGGAAQSVTIFKQSEHQEESWEFVKWWTSNDVQMQFGQELEAVLGVEARWNTANIEAFAELPWPEDDLKALTEQWKYYKEQPYVLGGYFTSRNIDNAWNRVVLGGMNTRESLEQAIKDINRELEAKQKEFGVFPDQE